MTKISSAKKIAGGALGLAAGAAAIAAGYYFFGKNGKQHRNEVSGWTKKAKKELMKKINRMKTVSETAYNKASNEVLKKYKLVKNIDPKELQAFGQELKSHWEQISKDAAKLGGKKSKPVKAKTGG